MTLNERFSFQSEYRLDTNDPRVQIRGTLYCQGRMYTAVGATDAETLEDTLRQWINLAVRP